MWERIASTILGRYLGDYIEGLNQQNLHLSLLQGKVELENLHFKKDIFNQFDLPVAVSDSVISKIYIDVPWTHLGSTPSRINLDGVFLVLNRCQVDQSLENLEHLHQQNKQRKLAKAELIRNQALHHTPESSEQSYGIGTRLLLRLISNLEVEITNVHIRYEDDITDPSSPFVCGLTFEKISGQTVDSEWAHSNKPTDSIMRKLFTLTNLSVYAHSQQFASQRGSGSAQLQQLMERTILCPPLDKCILAPLNASLKVAFDEKSSPETSHTPKLSTTATVTCTDITLEETQYQSIVKLLNMIQHYQRGLHNKYRDRRPKVGTKENPSAWWHYVGDAVLGEIRERKNRWTWKHMVQRSAIKNEYIDLFRKKSILGQKLSRQEEQRLKDLEFDLSFEDIIFYRSLADALAIKHRQVHPIDRQSKVRRWFESWLPGAGAEQLEEEEEVTEFQLTDDEWRKLYKTVEYEIKQESPPEQSTIGDYMLFQSTVSLGRGVVKLNAGTQSLIALSLEGLHVHLEKYKDGKACAGLTLDEIHLDDMNTANTQFGKIVSPSQPASSEDPFLVVNYSSHPPTYRPTYDYIIDLKMKPLEFVFNKRLHDRIGAYFTDMPTEVVEDLQELVAKQLQFLKENVQKKLLLILANKKTIGIDISLKAPMCIVPQDITNPTSPVIVIDPGKFTLQTKATPKESHPFEELQVMTDLYDEYELTMCNLKAIVCDHPQWKDQVADHGSLVPGDTLLAPFDFTVSIEISKIDSPSLSRAILTASLPELRAELSSNKIIKLMKIIKAATVSIEERETQLELHPSRYKNPNRQAVIDRAKRQVGMKPDTYVNYTLFEASIVAAKLSVSLLDDGNKELIELKALGLDIEAIKRPFDMDITWQLSDFVIEDKLQQYGDDFKFLADSYSVQSLIDPDRLSSLSSGSVIDKAHFIKIKVTNISDKSPHYEGYDNIALLNFDTLNVMFNGYTIAKLLQIMDTVKESVMQEEVETQKKGTRKKGIPTSTKVEAFLGKLEITLNHEGSQFASFSVENTSVTLGMHPYETRAFGFLGRLDISDMLPSSVTYTNLVGLCGEETHRMAEFSVIKKDLEEDKEEVTFNLHVHPLRLIVLNRFLQDIQFHINHLQYIREDARKYGKEAASKAKEYAKRRAAVKHTLVKLDVCIENPLLVVPSNTNSTDLIEVNLGTIKSFSALHHEANNQDVTVSIQGASIQLASFQKSTGKIIHHPDSKPLLEKFCVDITLSRPFLTDESSPITNSFIIKTNDIFMITSEPQVRSLVDYLGGNFTELSVLQKEAIMSTRPYEQYLNKEEPAQHISSRGKVQLLLHVPKLYITLEDQAHPFIRFGVDRFYTEYTERYDATMNTVVTINAVNMTDEREPTVNRFQTVFTTQTAQHNGFFILNYTRTANKDEDISIELNNPLVTVVPESVNPIKRFIARFSSVYHKLKKLTKANSPHPSELPANAPMDIHSSHLRVKVVNMRVRVVEPIKDKNPKGLVMDISRLLVDSYAVDQYHLVLQDVTMDRSLLLSDAPIFRIAEKFSVLLDSGLQRRETLETEQPIHLVLEFQDLEMMKAIAKSFTDTKQAEKLGPLKEDEKEILQLSKLLAIRLTIINEYDMIPFIDLQLTKTFFILQNWSAKTMKCEFGTQVKGNYFDANLDKWQPLIEGDNGKPWPVIVTMHNVQELHGSTTLMNITSPESNRLNFNVTSELVNNMAVTKQALKELQQHKVPLETQIEPVPVRRPFFIRNETGQPIQFWISVDSKITVPSGEEKPIKREQLQRITPLDRRSELLSIETFREVSKKICVQIPNYRVMDIPLGLTVPKICEIDHNTLLVCEELHKSGSKVLTLRSNVMIYNDSSTPVDIILEAPEIPQQNVLLGANANTAIPLSFVTTGLIRFRPPNLTRRPFSELMKWTNFDWTDPLHFHNLPEYQQKALVLRCESKDQSTIPWYYSVQVDSLETDSTEDPTKHPSQKSKLSDYRLTIRPPVVIENLLATPLQYQLVDGKYNTLLAKGYLESEEDLEFYHSPVEWSLLLASFCPPGFKWSALYNLKLGKARILEVKDDHDRTLILNVENKLKSASNTRKLSIYTDFCAVNKTGLKICYGYNNGRYTAAGTEAAIEEHGKPFWGHRVIATETTDFNLIEPDPSAASLFLLSFPYYTAKKLSIRVNGSEWSKGVSVDTIGDVGVLEMELPGMDNGHKVNHKFEVAVTVTRSANHKFWRTKIITISPRYILVNKLGRGLLFKQKGTATTYTLGIGQQMTFHCWVDSSQPHQFQCTQNGFLWSGSFGVGEPESGFDLEIKRDPTLPSVERAAPRCFIRVQIQIIDVTSYILFLPDNPRVPQYIVRNTTTASFYINQKGVNVKELVAPNSSFRVAWPEPSLSHVLQIQKVGSKEIQDFNVDIVKIWDITVSGHFEVETMNEGPTRVLKLSDIHITKKSFTEPTEDEEFVTGAFYLKLPGFGVSIIDQKPQEICYLTLDYIQLGATISNLQTKLEGCIESIQIDNQLPETPYPIALHPTILTDDNDDYPLINFTLTKSNSITTVESYDYISLLCREIDINVDEEFLIRMINFGEEIRRTVSSAQLEEQKGMIDKKIIEFPTNMEEAKRIYINTLHIHPLRVNLSYKAVAGIEEKYSKSVAMLLGMSTSILPSIDRAPMIFSGHLMKDPFTTQADLMNRLLSVYKSESTRQVYKIFGALEIIGSPVTFVNNIGSGVVTLYDKPSLAIKKATYSVFNAATDIGTELATFIQKIVRDQEFSSELKKQNEKEEPATVAQGVAKGVEDLTMGIKEGATAIQKETAEADQGIGSFLKALSTGIVRTVARPGVGAIEMPTQISRGLKNQMKVQQVVARKKPPMNLKEEITVKETKRRTSPESTEQCFV